MFALTAEMREDKSKKCLAVAAVKVNITIPLLMNLSFVAQDASVFGPSVRIFCKIFVWIPPRYGYVNLFQQVKSDEKHSSILELSPSFSSTPSITLGSGY